MKNESRKVSKDEFIPDALIPKARYYIASCSSDDLWVECNTYAEAREVAQRHRQETGHDSGVIPGGA
jgi:hypothetical protein